MLTARIAAHAKQMRALAVCLRRLFPHITGSADDAYSIIRTTWCGLAHKGAGALLALATLLNWFFADIVMCARTHVLAAAHITGCANGSVLCA